MEYQTIGKQPAEAMTVKPNLPDLDAAKKDFQWSDIYAELDWLPGGYLNQAHECIDRHVEAGRGDKTAMIWVGKNGEEERYTFSDMKRETAKFANVLEGLGVPAWRAGIRFHGAAAGALLRDVRRPQAWRGRRPALLGVRAGPGP